MKSLSGNWNSEADRRTQKEGGRIWSVWGNIDYKWEIKLNYIQKHLENIVNYAYLSIFRTSLFYIWKFLLNIDHIFF